MRAPFPMNVEFSGSPVKLLAILIEIFPVANTDFVVEIPSVENYNRRGKRLTNYDTSQRSSAKGKAKCDRLPRAKHGSLNLDRLVDKIVCFSSYSLNMH